MSAVTNRGPVSAETDVGALGTTPDPFAQNVPSAAQRWRLVLLLSGLLLGLFLSELDQTVFATALPTIVSDLGRLDLMVWVTTANVVAGTVVMPVVGKLGDLMGRRPVTVAALTVLVAGSVVGGLAPDMGWLIVGRILQGLGGGGIIILVQASVADVVPARQRPRVLSLVGAVFAASAVIGPVLGGWLTDGVGWRWAFWLYVPLGVLAIVTAAALLPRSEQSRDHVKVDVAGITALVVAVTSVVLVTTWAGSTYAWSSPVVVGLVIVTLVAVGTFIVAERRAVEPVIPLALFSRRNFAVPTLAGLVLAVAMFGTIAYLPTYLQRVPGLSPTASGLVLLSLIGGLGLATVVSAQSVSRTGNARTRPLGGAALVTAALVFLAAQPESASVPVLTLGLFGLGAGIGAGLQILVVIVQDDADPSEVGTVTAAHTFFREVGVAIGATVVGTVFTVRLQRLLDADVTSVTAYHEAFTPVLWLLAPLALLATVALVFVRPAPLATTLDPSADPLSAEHELMPEPRSESEHDCEESR